MTRTHARNVALLAALSAAGTAAAGPDLVITEGVFESIYEHSDRIVFGLAYTMVNAGDEPTDLGGPDDTVSNDNVSIQTYLVTSPDLSGQARAAGGGAIWNPVVLEPGAVYEGVYYANSAQLPDPLDPGDFRWLVVDIVATDEPAPALANNRTIYEIPTPCGRADRAAPIGALDLADVTRFAEWFTAGNEAADYNSDGIFSLDDVTAFVNTFLAGC